MGFLSFKLLLWLQWEYGVTSKAITADLKWLLCIVVSWSLGDYSVVIMTTITAIMTHRWKRCDLLYKCWATCAWDHEIFVLTSAEPEEARGDLSSLADRPLHTVVFIKSRQDRWRFQTERKIWVSLQTETARTSQRSGTVCPPPSAAGSSKDRFHFLGLLLYAFACSCLSSSVILWACHQTLLPQNLCDTSWSQLSQQAWNIKVCSVPFPLSHLWLNGTHKSPWVSILQLLQRFSLPLPKK